MSPVRHEECKNKPHYFEMFLGESIAGGNTDPPKPPFKRHQGLGDTVAWVAKKMGFEQKKGCGCKKRQSKLNTMVPYNILWHIWDSVKDKQ